MFDNLDIKTKKNLLLIILFEEILSLFFIPRILNDNMPTFFIVSITIITVIIPFVLYQIIYLSIERNQYRKEDYNRMEFKEFKKETNMYFEDVEEKELIKWFEDRGYKDEKKEGEGWI